MTRRRRVPLVLSVCIGIFLLLSSAVTADTSKDPPVSPGKEFSLNTPQISISEDNKTITRKISSEIDIGSTSTEKRDEFIEPFTKRYFETTHDGLTKDVKTEDEEKVPTLIDKDSNPQRSTTEDQVDKLSTADTTNGGTKLEELIYGTSGKSSSTKAVSEDFYRLSRTNGLTTVTTKPSLEESKNKTAQVQPLKNATKEKLESEKNVKPLEDTSELKEVANSEVEVLKEKEASTSSELKLEVTNGKNDSEAQKIRFPEEFLERKKKSGNPSSMKNSEVPDLKEADESKRNDGSISLINDTYVNYSHRYKTSTESSLETENGNQSRSFEVSPVTHKTAILDPKKEVEVVSNVTHATIQRIVDQNPQSSSLNNSSLPNEINEKAKINDSKIIQNSTGIQNSSIPETRQTVTETSTTVQITSSPVPRGRTIAFLELNDFSDLEIKPTISSKLDVSFSKRNITEKPYPYIKSTTKDQIPSSSNQILDATTEEPSALENTIGKGQSEENFIVTEASDVLENSIQQFKPTYFEKVNNGSTVSSIEVRSSVPMTTASFKLQEAVPTNQTVIDKSNDSIRIAKPEEKSRNEGNDVPRWSESHETITRKGNFDVTGNGITEVSLKGDKLLQEIASRTTPLTTESLLPHTDIQRNAEDSLLIRSTLNVTELSTEYPLVKDDLPGTEKTVAEDTIKSTDSATVLPTSIEETSVGDVTEVARIANANGNNEISSGVNSTSSPDESFTTTTIEYEFVGLTESTTFIGRNGTEVNEMQNSSVTVAPVHDSSVKNESRDVTTLTYEFTTENSSTGFPTDDVSSTDDRISSIPVTDPTIVPTTMGSDEGTTMLTVTDGEVDQSTIKEDEVLKTTSVSVDFWSTTTEEDTLMTTVRVDQTVTFDSKDSPFIVNVTEASVEFTTVLDVNTTETTTLMATSVPVTPIATSSLKPRVSSSTAGPSASDLPTETTDDGNMMTPEQEEITSLVRIVMKGSWYDVCPQKDKLKISLAEVLKTGMNKSVSDKQIMFHQDPCQESPSSTPTPSDIPLMSMLVYVVNENGKFDSAMTKILPSLYEDFKERVNFPVAIHRILLVQETIPDSGNAIAVIVVSSIAFICLILLAGLLFIMRKRQTRFNYGERCRPVSLDAYSLDSVSAYNSVRRKGVARSSKRSYGNPTFEDSSAIPSHPLNFAGLSSFCNDVNAINEEYSGIPQVSAKIDELPPGAELKNRYANVIPLPETRVPLQKINNDPLSEYINASYVRGPKNATRYYIACQAPMESTVTDFWRMVWEQQCKVIIMLTDLVENGVEKCTEYVPPSEVTDCHRLYGDYQVTLKKRETKEKYAISTLHLKNLENNTFREVYHIWYLWPVNGAQSDGAGLIAVLLEARALQRGGPGPIVVHCSPGTGRTGTLIALDLGIRQYEITRTVDVPRVVYTIRRDRAGAVQTKEQYAFIYKALNLYATKLAGGVLEST